MATTLLTLIQNIARDGYGYVGTITPSAAGATTTVIAGSAGTDVNLDPDDAENLFGSAWLKCESDSANSTNVGQVRRIDATVGTGYDPSTGTITVTRAFSNATTTTMRFGIYLGLPPTSMGMQKGITQFINDVLRRIFYHRPHLLTLITDGDMELSGVTNWTASNLDVSASIKSTTTGVMLGDRSLRVKNSAANGYFQSATVSVQPGKGYYAAADVTVASGTGVLELWDVTNGVSISTKSSTEYASQRVWFHATMPSTCFQAAIRLKGTEITADVYWDNVSLLHNTAKEMPLPSWFTDKEWLESVRFYYPGSAASTATNLGALDEQRRRPAQWWDVHEDREAATPFKVLFSPSIPASALLVVHSLSPHTELSADTDSTDANPDYVKAQALWLIAIAKKDKDKIAEWEPHAMQLDKMYQAVWEGKTYMMPTLD